MNRTTVDSEGNVVNVGDSVRVISLPPIETDTDAPETAIRIASFVGERLDVYEIDEWGRAWVEKYWAGTGHADAESLALEPENMVVHNER